MNFHEKAHSVKVDVATATTVYALAARAMLPSALSVSHSLFGGSVHYEIRLDSGSTKVLQSSDRPLLERGPKFAPQSP